MDYKLLGANIKSYRKASRITQQELADRIGRTKNSVQKYEKGLVKIPNNVIEKIAMELNVPISKLIQNVQDSVFSKHPFAERMNAVSKPGIQETKKQRKCLLGMLRLIYDSVDEINEKGESLDQSEKYIVIHSEGKEICLSKDQFYALFRLVENMLKQMVEVIDER